MSADQYEAMARAGILTEHDRVELVHGLLVNKMTKNPPHSVAARAVADALGRLVPAGYFVTREDRIRVSVSSELEPDAAVVRGASRDFSTRHPAAADVPLVVEVADWSLAFDRSEKLAIYAESGIPQYWIVNLIDGRLEVHSDPEGRSYRTVQSFGPGEVLSLEIDERDLGAIVVSDLLP
jgi:Uma2 family endonuclease